MAVDTGVGAAPATVDPTKPAKYPIILGDALRGKPATEIFTGIRLNHQPTLSSDTAPDIAKLHHSSPSSASSSSSSADSSSSQSFGLSFTDDASKGAYEYAGTRATDPNQYVLYFDATRQAFILDRVDSVFSMNVTRTPECSDAEALAQQFEHLDTTVPPIPSADDHNDGDGDDYDDDVAIAAEPTPASTQESTTRTKKTAAKTTAKTTAKTVSPTKKGKTAAAGGQTAAARKRAEKAVAAPKTAAKKETAASKAKQPTTTTKKPKAASAATPAAGSTAKAAAAAAKPTKPAKPVELLLPEPAPAPPPPTISLPPAESPKRSSRRRSDSPDDEDSDDDDGGLLVEYPDAPGGVGGGDTALANNFSPAFQIPQRQWSELLNREDEDGGDEGGGGNQYAGDHDDNDNYADNDDDDNMNAEYEEEEDDDADVHELQLPSPVGGRPGQDDLQQSFEFDDGGEEDGGAADADLDEDLAAALEAELAESEVSEED